MLKTVFIFECKKLAASRSFYFIVICLLLTAIYSLYNGRKFISGQQKNIQLAIARENIIFDEVVSRIQHPDTATADAKWAYSHLTDPGWIITSPNKRWTSWWQPTQLSFLSIGNRDVYPYYHELEPYSFYMRFFKNEISSPFKLLYGNFDLAFVITLLFPLFIIGFTFDVYAVEQESGTYALLNTVTRADKIILCKLLFYLALTLAMINIILLVSLLFGNSITIKQWFSYATTANLYILTWFFIVYLVGLLKRSSVLNAIILISCWIFLSVGLPAIFNAVANASYPVNAEAFSKYIRRVQMSDNPAVKRSLLKEFYHYYPQYANTDTIGPSYSNKLYTAYGNLNDRHADPLLNEYFKQMQQREDFLNACNFFNPVTRCQQRFNTLSGTDLQSYITYVKQVRQYVQGLKENLTQKCFDGVPLKVSELQHRLSFDQFNKSLKNK
ncbi:DUF3526 domain-containing protein [Mucilaginibacter gilvus]|uniref:DUF3526 domain-containing protein n=1 Tax=Mucilaginibacter gilvus TaxID=2305909 RepID=A0A444MJE1_9SPHI|nr:DUF3526 domain-containing protein [Mucilaginibacter gilvus]RWY48312.1 DUF3526 domain-containing protein [Mucilaginibacter gilvus]